MEPVFLWLIVIVLGMLLLFAMMSSVNIIKPYEQGLYEKLGKFVRILEPGLNLVVPFVSSVHRIDLRTQTLDIPRQEVVTRDNSPTVVDAIIYIKVIDPVKAHYQIQNYKLATISLAQTNLRAIIGEMELDEVFYNRNKINHTLREVLDKDTDPWGVKVEMVEIREVDPVGAVKSAMEEQTASERQKRAAILRAEGMKRSAVLEAEGKKRARILAAEGVRQARILEAEGERTAMILRSQGDSQRLRILSLGAATMDQKALTVISLDTLRALGDGKATKIVFPFELTRLVEGAADYIGAGIKSREHTVASLDELRTAIGEPDAILGTVPNPGEMKEQIDLIEKETRLEAEKLEKLPKGG